MSDKRSEASRVLVVGNFPPPVHGMALVNAAVYERLLTQSSNVRALNTSPADLSRSAMGWLVRVGGLLRALFAILGVRGVLGRTIYISLSGGKGQLFDLCLLVAARLRHYRIVVHHHSFAYLTEPSVLASTLFRVIGPDGLHIALCDKMEALLKTRYRVSRVIVVSNAAVIDPPATSRRKNDLRTIGFLGNISADKGIYEFLDTAEMLERIAPDASIRAIVAGGFADAATAREVARRIARLRNTSHIGAVYGKAKFGFLMDIDVLLFPSSYRNEAEPLTVLEALACGTPVIASDRGCIPEVLAAGGGVVLPDIGTFAADAAAQLTTWIENPSEFRAVCERVKLAFERLKERHSGSIAALF